MDALRVSATDIDSYRRFRANEDAELADLLAHLRKETPPTEAMLAGTAFHAALEIAEPGAEFPQMEANGFLFDITVDAEIDLPQIREMKATRDYLIGDCLVTLVGKVDAIQGHTVFDHKLTGRYDAERFLGSYQWRVYLEVFGANTFVWNVFEAKETGPKHRTIHALHRLTAHRYPGMDRDVTRELSLFVDLARLHLPERMKPRKPLDFEAA